jgi:UDP:flavonoid glycosyltransferase YjiC (YdhE family)
MAHFVFLTWDGGGNVSVALGISAELIELGHTVNVLGPGSLRSSVEERGIGYQQLGSSPPTDPPMRSEYLMQVTSGSAATRDRLSRLLRDLEPDGVVIDCNLAWALQLPTGLPTAVLVHTALGLYVPAWQSVIDAANEKRGGEGLEPLSSAAEAWSAHDLLLITSVAAFDRPPKWLPPHAVYVGPVTSSPTNRADSSSARSETDGDPLVLVSYSTDPMQNSPERVQRALDALADLPLRVVATTSGVFQPAELSVPENAVVAEYVPVDQMLRGAAIVVSHAGHGTTLTALCHGVPVICIPGIGRDQIPIANRVAELGLGVALSQDATSNDLHRAVTEVLEDASFQDRARAFQQQCGPLSGVAGAAAGLMNMIAIP